MTTSNRTINNITTGEEEDYDDDDTTSRVNAKSGITNTTNTTTVQPVYPTTTKQCCLPTIVLGSSSSSRRNRYKINIQDTIEKFQSLVTISDTNRNTTDTDTDMIVVDHNNYKSNNNNMGNSSCFTTSTTTTELNDRQTVVVHEHKQQQQQLDDDYDNSNKKNNFPIDYTKTSTSSSSYNIINNNIEYLDDVYDLITRVYKTQYVPKSALKNDYYSYRKLYIEPIPVSGTLSLSSSSNNTTTNNQLPNLLTRKWKEYFHTWNDNNPKTHLLQWTCIYVCPISGELFFSSQWGCSTSTTGSTTINTTNTDTNTKTNSNKNTNSTDSTTDGNMTAVAKAKTETLITDVATETIVAPTLPITTTTTTTTNSSSIPRADPDTSSTMEVNMIVVDKLSSLQNINVDDTTGSKIAIDKVEEETKIMEDDTNSHTTTGTSCHSDNTNKYSSMSIDIDDSNNNSLPSKPKRKVNEEKDNEIDYYCQHDEEETVTSKEQKQQQRDSETKSSNCFQEKRRLKQLQKEANKLLPQQQPLSGTQSTYTCYNYITEMKQQEQEQAEEIEQQQQHTKQESTNNNNSCSSSNSNTTTETTTQTIIEKSPLRWFARKGYAEDGAAAICFDCKVYRERQLIIDEQNNNSNSNVNDNDNDNDELILQDTTTTSTSTTKKKQHRPIPDVAKIGLEIPYLEINGYMSIPYEYQQYVPKYIQVLIQQQQTDIFINQRIQRQMNTKQ